MSEQNLIYGIDVHARSLTSFPAEENRAIFLIASYSLKNDSKVYLLEADDRWSRISGKGFEFDQSVGEIVSLNAHPLTKKLIFSACSTKLAEGKISSTAAICELDEVNKAVKTLGTFTPADLNGILLKAEFNSTGDSLAVVAEDRLIKCDVDGSNNALAEAWSHKFLKKSKMNVCVWDKHNPHTIYASSGTELHLFDTRTNKECLILDNGFHRLTAIDCNPLSPNRIALGSEEGRISLWDTRKTDFPITSRADHQHRIWDLKYNHTYEQLLISCAGDGRIILYNLEDVEKAEGKMESELVAEAEDSVYSCAWAGSDPFVFAAIGYDGRLTASRVRKSLKYKLLQGS